MRHLWVRYANGTSDVVGQVMLDDLLVENKINQFYRPSESRWITLGIDPVRENGGRYAGPERRVIPVIEPRPWVDTGERTARTAAGSVRRFLSWGSEIDSAHGDEKTKLVSS
jgi:hypothetical protein